MAALNLISDFFFSFFSIVIFSWTVKTAEICQVLLQISQESTGLPLAPMPVGNSLVAKEFPEKKHKFEKLKYWIIKLLHILIQSDKFCLTILTIGLNLIQFDPIHLWIGWIGSNRIKYHFSKWIAICNWTGF